jgi:alginate O-acetyltransferase complex protein AlgI
MVFSSIAFLFLFLPAILFGFATVHPRLRLLVLLLASLAFYFYGENYLIWVMLTTTVVDYTCALMIARAWRPGPVVPLTVGGARCRSQRAWLGLSIAANLSLLAYFKYAGFLSANVLAAGQILGLGDAGQQAVVQVALPLGISFYTFQSMSYTIDVYRGHVAANRNLLRFATFVTMFPQLVAGPIVRYADVESQLERHGLSMAQFALGVQRFLIGLAKKVLLANPLGEVADAVFGLPANHLSTPVAWLGAATYSLQLYFDFSGYSCMAIGLGRMFGFTFPENFDYPYCARSVRQFWQRWHMTLSQWFRDYLYFPLGGNHRPGWPTWRNLFVVFLTCGLWHGASWNFALWGLFHGGFMAMERTRLGQRLQQLPKAAQHAYLLLVVGLGWVVFRCETLPAAGAFLTRMFVFQPSTTRVVAEFVPPGALLAMACSLVLSTPAVNRALAWTTTWPGPARLAAEVGQAVVLFSLFFLCVLNLLSGSYNPFIYFRF